MKLRSGYILMQFNATALLFTDDIAIFLYPAF